jgi:glycosyltransferase involved in cell wall biosynthesis
MKVLFVSHSSELYGAERSMLEAVAGLTERNVVVEVVVPSEGELTAELRTLGVKVHLIPYTWWVASPEWRDAYYKMRRKLQNLMAAPKFNRLIRQLRPDVVITNTLTISAGAFASERAKIPHVWYVHEFAREDSVTNTPDLNSEKHSGNFYFDLGMARSLSLMNKLSTRVIANSKAVALSLSNYIPTEKLRIVYYAVGVSPEAAPAKSKNEELSLICVGRLETNKRQEDAIRAIAKLQTKGLKLRLVLIGPGVLGYEEKLRQLASSLGAKESVEFVGSVSDAQPYFAQADIALVCARNEAFGRVTIEAMKAGKPVIGADHGGTSELISDGENGLKFRPGDSDDLARKIEILYHDESLRKEMGSRAQVWALTNFTREKYSGDLLQIIQEIVPAKGIAA